MAKVVQPFCIRQKETPPSASAKTDSTLHTNLATNLEYKPGWLFRKFDTTARSHSRQSSVGLLSRALLQSVAANKAAKQSTVANHGFDEAPAMPAFFHLVLTTVVVKSLLRNSRTAHQHTDCQCCINATPCKGSLTQFTAVASP